MTEEPPQREPHRVSAACRACRHSKLKCSGTQPCDRCRRRSRDCIFDTREDRDAHDVRIAPPLKRPRRDNNDQHPFRQSPTSAQTPLPPPHNATLSTAQTPRTASQEAEAVSGNFLRNRPDKRKRWLYLGASATWSFHLRVATLIRSHLRDDLANKYEGFALDGDAYNISLRKPDSNTHPDLSRLPSLDYAIYLVDTVKFHLGGILRLFDEEEFVQNLHAFYAEGPDKAGTDRLWYTQCLLILALGKGFLNVGRTSDNTSSADFFLRAMSILPDTVVLHEEPVLAAEVLSMIALYFYCLDMKNCAYSYIGQALRLALVEGLHAGLPVARVGAKFSERCRNLWWTIYILDRTLSSAVGAPVSVQDDHIRQPLGSPRQSSQRDATLIMHVKLCRVVSFILTELYTADGSLEQSYLSRTRSILRRMAEIAKELEDTIDFKFKSTLDTLSKGALYLRMLYNQCIILATRPVLICLLQDILRSVSNGNGRRTDIPSSIQDLVQTCVTSATKTLKMLNALTEHNLLDAFLPFELEFACSASSVLIMVDEVLRGQKIPETNKSLITKVLDDMAAGGNKAAPVRQTELQQVSHLARRLWEAIATREHANMTRSMQEQTVTRKAESGDCHAHETSANPSDSARKDDQPAAVDPTVPTLLPANDYSSGSFDLDDADPFLQPMSTTSSTDFAQAFDFSQEQMQLLADHLDVTSPPSLLDFGSHRLDEWL